jgi:prepilin-type processing-associated H-X9-DG protein
MDMAAALTPYAWEFRYLDDLSETYPTREEFDEALQHAQAIYDFVLQVLPAAGGNILYLDGHVAWRNFRQMEVRQIADAGRDFRFWF